MKLLIVIPEISKHPVPSCISRNKVFLGKINGRNHDVIYKFLKEEYGETCAYCGKSLQELKTDLLDIDHVDGNSFHHFWRNLVLACHKCNCRKNSKNWKQKMSPISLALSGGDMPRPATAETYLKTKYLPDLLKWLEEVFQDTDRILKKRVYGEGRLAAGFPARKTIDDYLEVITCTTGPLYEWKSEGEMWLRLRSNKVSISDFKEKYCR